VPHDVEAAGHLGDLGLPLLEHPGGLALRLAERVVSRLLHLVVEVDQDLDAGVPLGQGLDPHAPH
jgi:hypothetical protein